MIEVHQLNKQYGDRPAIVDLNFTINKGEVVGFLGPNGAGKTTTMKIITGFMAPSSGSVSIGGHNVFEEPIEAKKMIGYLPELPPLYLDMRVSEYLKFVARLKRVEAPKIKKYVDESIEKTQLGDVKHRVIGNLSKGYRQRVGIAQSLVSKPEVLVLDEPTVGLDPKQVAGIRELLKDLTGEHTIILSTHILSEVQATCEKIIIINQGHIVEQGSLKELTEKMQGGQKISLKLQKIPSTLMGELKLIEGVKSVEQGAERLFVSLHYSEALAVQISEAIVASGAGLLEMNSVNAGLEDIFIKLTDEAELK